MAKDCRVILKKGREKPLLKGHPWIFSGAIKEIINYDEPGVICTVQNEKSEKIAKGYINDRSNITVRVLTLEDVSIDEIFIQKKIKNALSFRDRYFSKKTNAFRIVNSEGDFFPGLIVDKYDRGVVIQALTAGTQRLKGLIVDALINQVDPEFIYERSDLSMAQLEVLTITDNLIYGNLKNPLTINEYSLNFYVDVIHGQKTGFYLDQRKNRFLLSQYVRDASVLNCFSYTGAFGIYALKHGARSVVNVETSEKALALAKENASLNKIEPQNINFIKDDVFQYLRKIDELYDIIILDPPKFASSKADIPGASRGYKDINLNALRHLRKGGFLFTFSCSSIVSPDLFQKIVFGASNDAKREVQIIEKLHADIDHPFNIAHREGEYLKGFILRVL